MRATTPDKPLTADFTTFMGNIFSQVARAIKDGVKEAAASTVLLRLLASHFNRVGMGISYKNVCTFDVSMDTPFFDLCRNFYVIVSAATDSEISLARRSGVGLVSKSEVVRMEVKRALPQLDAHDVPGGYGYGTEAVRHFGRYMTSY